MTDIPFRARHLSDLSGVLSSLEAVGLSLITVQRMAKDENADENEINALLELIYNEVWRTHDDLRERIVPEYKEAEGMEA